MKICLVRRVIRLRLLALFTQGIGWGSVSSFATTKERNISISEYAYEVAFPLENANLAAEAPVLTVLINGKQVFHAQPHTDPLTGVHSGTGRLSSHAKQIEIQVQRKDFNERQSFKVDLDLGAYLYLLWESDSKLLRLKQEKSPRGYD